jgi:hypothetical protein
MRCQVHQLSPAERCFGSVICTTISANAAFAIAVAVAVAIPIDIATAVPSSRLAVTIGPS